MCELSLKFFFRSKHSSLSRQIVRDERKKKVFNFEFRFDVVAEPTVVASADSAGVADQDAQLEETLVEGGRPRTTSTSSKGSPTR
jgi:hypothetical protein